MAVSTLQGPKDEKNMWSKRKCAFGFLEREREKRVGCINFELFLRALAAAAPPILVR